MFFCNECRFSFNITKDVKSKQLGGKINDSITNLLDKFCANNQIVEADLSKITKKDLMDNDRYELMGVKHKKKIMSQIKNVSKDFFVEEPETIQKAGATNAYFICKFCKNNKPIKPGTLIYSKNYNSNESSELDTYKYAINNPILMRTKNYICKNSKCETHKNDSLKEAVLTKNNIEQLVYVCCVCETHWTNTI